MDGRSILRITKEGRAGDLYGSRWSFSGVDDGGEILPTKKPTNAAGWTKAKNVGWSSSQKIRAGRQKRK